MLSKNEKAAVKEAYQIKLSKYKNKIDSLTIHQKSKLFRQLMREAVYEIKLQKYTAKQIATISKVRGEV